MLIGPGFDRTVCGNFMLMKSLLH